MRIEKEYNVQEILNEIKEEIKNCFERGARNVWINPLIAQGVVDVLETVASWENKGEKSSNISDEEIKGCCFGWHINGGKKCNLCVYEKECMIESEERKKCFGKSYGKRPVIVCGTCKRRELCKELTKHE